MPASRYTTGDPSETHDSPPFTFRVEHAVELPPPPPPPQPIKIMLERSVRNRWAVFIAVPLCEVIVVLRCVAIATHPALSVLGNVLMPKITSACRQ